MLQNELRPEQKEWGQHQEMLQSLPPGFQTERIFCLSEPKVGEDGRLKDSFFVPVTYKLINEKTYSNPAFYNSLAEVQAHMTPFLYHHRCAIGFLGGICAIKLSDCCGNDGQTSELAARIINTLTSKIVISNGVDVQVIFKASGFQFDESRYRTANPDIGLELYIEGHTDKCMKLDGDIASPVAELEEQGDVLPAVMDAYLCKIDAAIVAQAGDATRGNASVPAKLSDDEVIKKASAAANGDKFAALIAGDTSDYDNNRTQAVMALACQLAFWTGKDTEQMDRIFRNTPLMSYEWDMPDKKVRGKNVGEVILQKAVAHVAQTYDPQVYLQRKAGQIIVYTSDGPISLVDFQPERRRYSSTYGWDHIGASHLFADCYKHQLLYVLDRNRWYAYNGKVWEPNDAAPMECAKEFAEALNEYARSLPMPKDDDDTTRKDFIEYTEKLKTRKSRETLLKDASSVYPVRMAEFDKDIYTFNCLNGTLDLHTGKFAAHNPADRLTKLANVSFDPAAAAPRWEQHMSEVMDGDMEKVAYMQKIMGYGLTGDTKYECFFILYGPTSRNGKGTTMEAYIELLGDYGRTSKPETLAQKPNPNGSGPSEDIARLAGARIVNFSEADQKMVLSSSLVKTLTGNDTITARYLHENSFEFRPQAKIMMNTNHLPRITDITVFRSGRVKVIPFEHQFSGDKQDKNLKQVLRRPENLSGILNWCIKGLRLLEATGFDMPASVQAAIAEYERDSDKIARFIEDRMEENPLCEITTQEAYNVYTAWCEAKGHYAENQTTFKQAMEAHVTVRRKRPTDKRLGNNPLILICGYKWKAPGEWV